MSTDKKRFSGIGQNSEEEAEPILLIDSSYYNFYRFTATVKWYSYSEERQKQAEGVPWIDNPVFMKTFEKMWFETLRKLCTKFHVKTKNIIFARDGHKVWRYDIYPKYKATRGSISVTEDIHNPGPVFKHINKTYHAKVEDSKVILVQRAEADDVIAVAVRYLQHVKPHNKIIIITGDHDLLQLISDNVDIYQLRGLKKFTNNSHVALMTKILAGDPSDNIPAAYKGCGKVTAARLAQNPAELEKILDAKGRAQYELNRQLIDFNYIPDDIVAEIESKLDAKLETTITAN